MVLTVNRTALGLLFLWVLLLDSVSSGDEPVVMKPLKTITATVAGEASGLGWTALVGSWKFCQFGGEGQVEIEDNYIEMEMGDPLTGLRWEGDVMRENYEIELEARRTKGFDFFCGLTFPVGEQHVSFILGGWGGGVVGISSIDGLDASENDTTQYRDFKINQWYKVRVRVDPKQISGWIDEKLAVEQPRADHQFSIRNELELCLPLGLAAYQCKSEFRNLRLRALSKNEIAEANKKRDMESTE